MKEVEINGTKYGLNLAYGILKELEGGILEKISDETFDNLKDQADNLDDLEQKAVIKLFQGKDLKMIMLDEKVKGPQTIAMVLRTVDGKEIGVNFEERLEYVTEQLDYDDGEEIFELLEAKLKKIEDGKKAKGESKLTSKERGEQAKVPLPEH